MTDLGPTIAPKSDQLNADDLIAGPRTITVRDVRSTGNADQPISIYFEGDNGKPYKPGKSMRRVLVALWGRDGTGYIGRALTIFRDPEVKFGGDPVGGIRISHMSHIEGERTMPLTATRGSRKQYTVKPLQAARQQQQMTQGEARQAIMDAVDLPGLERAWKSAAMRPFREELQAEMELRKQALNPADPADDPNPQTDDGGEYDGV